MAKAKTTPIPAPEADAPSAQRSATNAVNHVTIIGRLCADPILRHTSTGKPVASMRLAVNNRGTATFLNVSAWMGLAETCAAHLSSGRLVAVVGRLQSQDWEKDGERRSSQVIVASQVQFLDSKRNAA